MEVFFKRILDIGVTNNISKKETKKIKMLNISCVFWVFFALFLIAKFLIFDANPLPISLFHCLTIVLLILIIYIQKLGKFLKARILFIAFLFINLFLISNYFKPSVLAEYFYILIPVFTLYFINNNKIQYVALVLSIILFYLPNQYWNHYPEFVFGSGNFLGVFLAPFLIIKYLMNLNTINETSLEIQKNAALEDKNIINDQHKKLEELSRFKSQFFINISHEIRTPLTLILGSADALNEHEVYQYNKSVRDIANNINKQSKKIQTIVDDVIDLAKMNTNQFNLNLKEVSLSQFLNTSCLSFEPFFKQSNILFRYKSNIDCNVSIDIVYLERALNNLIFNAIKYTPEGGVVSLTFDKKTETSVVIRLKDNGIGIPDVDLKKIFERFYQSYNDINKSSGSGIGLAFTKEIVELLNGSIDVISKEGLGSEFLITLPVISFATEVNIKNDIKHSILNTKKRSYKFAANNSKKKLLIVDDHEEMRIYIISLLKQYECIEATNGIEALSILKHTTIDMVITDYMMPKMDGYEFIKEIKKQKIKVPILMLTARTDFDGKLNVLRLGLDDYITKPFNKEELKIRISNILINNQSRNDFIKSKEELNIDFGEEKFTNTLEKFIIEQCQDASFGIEEILEKFIISKSSFYRKIKMATGLSPNEFINEVKLQYARRLLTNNNEISLKELSHKLGFKQPQYFSKLYQKRFGKKPSEF